MWASQLVDWSVSHRNHQTRSRRKRVKDRRTCEAREVVTVWLYELQRSFPQKKYVTTEWEYMELITLFAPGWFLHPHHARVWSQWSRGSLSDEHAASLCCQAWKTAHRPTHHVHKNRQTWRHIILCQFYARHPPNCLFVCVFLTDMVLFLFLSLGSQGAVPHPRWLCLSVCVPLYTGLSSLHCVLLISLRAVNTINNSTRFKIKQRALGAEAEQHTWLHGPDLLWHFNLFL